MDIEKISEKDNPLLARAELEFKIKFEGATPRIEEVRKAINTRFKYPEELMIVDSIDQQYGKTEARVYAKIYENYDAMKIELKHNLKTNFPPKEPKEEKE